MKNQGRLDRGNEKNRDRQRRFRIRQRENRPFDWKPKGKTYKGFCSICQKPFETNYKSKEICSHLCRKEIVKKSSREWMRRKRNGDKQYAPCLVCGFKETTDVHHEIGKTFILCPNHHTLITRGIKTLTQLLSKEAIHNAPTSPEKEEFVTLKDILSGSV